MNILIIDNSLAFTGAFKCALSEAMLLSDKHKFTFVIHPNSRVKANLEANNILYHTIKLQEIRKSPSILLYPFALLLNTYRVSSIIKREQIDVVQMNDFYNLIGALLKIFGYKGKLITYVRFVPSAMPAPFRKLWTFFAQRYSHHVIAVSDTVLKELPVNKNTIRLYDPANLQEQITEEKKESDTVQLLYLSNYIRGKGQDYALEAFINAYKHNKQLRLKYTGGDMGLEKNREFKQMLIDKVKEHGLEDVVSFSDFNSNVEAEIKAADVLLNFSNSESLSMTCLEAAYYGTAVIATKCGGPEEVIVDKETGLLVPVADINAMMNAILTLANNATIRKQYAEAGKKYVRNKFSKEHFTKEFEAILAQ
ncbi:MAG: glycosyltransferase [Flavipsychrobacter sp.]|nr:glycosyltransferase [Flavipsychrobacter sp.]